MSPERERMWQARVDFATRFGMAGGLLLGAWLYSTDHWGPVVFSAAFFFLLGCAMYLRARLRYVRATERERESST